MPSVVGQITKGAVFDVLVDADAVGGDAGANTLPDATVAASNVTQHVGLIDHDLLLNFLASEHFAVASIDHTLIANIGTNSHAAIDTHIANTSDPHGSAMTISVLLSCPQIANLGDITLDASDPADTKVWVKNSNTGQADLDVEGDIVVGGNVDGRDVAADGATLDELEVLALAYAVAL